MKANNKRKVFGDAVDLLMDEIEEREVPRGIQMIQIRKFNHFMTIRFIFTRENVWRI